MKKLIHIIVIIFTLALPSLAYANVFGQNLSIGATDAFTSSRINCSQVTTPANGTITSITYAVDGTVGTATTLGAAIYTDSGSGPGTLLASSYPSSTAKPATVTWATTSISYIMTAGQSLYLCAWANGTFSIMHDGGSYINYYQVDSSWETWPTTFSGNAYTNYYISIYATYTPTSSPTNNFTPFLVKLGTMFSVMKGAIFQVR